MLSHNPGAIVTLPQLRRITPVTERRRGSGLSGGGSEVALDVLALMQNLDHVEGVRALSAVHHARACRNLIGVMPLAQAAAHLYSTLKKVP